MVYSPEGVVLLTANQIQEFVDLAHNPKLQLHDRLLALARAFTPLVLLDLSDKLAEGPMIPVNISRSKPFYSIRNTRPPDGLGDEAIFVYHARAMALGKRNRNAAGLYAMEYTQSAGFDKILASVGRVVASAVVGQ